MVEALITIILLVVVIAVAATNRGKSTAARQNGIPVQGVIVYDQPPTISLMVSRKYTIGVNFVNPYTGVPSFAHVMVNSAFFSAHPQNTAAMFLVDTMGNITPADEMNAAERQRNLIAVGVGVGLLALCVLIALAIS